jgi:dTDP-4-dehydrorhamnose reductase
MLKKNTIVVTGGTGRFAQRLKNVKCKYSFLYPSKKKLDIQNIKLIKKYLIKNKPESVLHLAGLSRPMIIHEKDIGRSINLNIIGTANLVKICSELGIKMIYFSTSYVYPGTRGNYKEKDSVLPWNNYAWSKLGGECAVQMYKNSLILRVCMTEKPFTHKEAFTNVKLNFIFHEELAKILVKVLNKKGIINIGGPTRTVYEFAKKYNKQIKKKFNNKKSKQRYPSNCSMDLSKLKKMVKYR